jgi:hypothetical protein
VRGVRGEAWRGALLRGGQPLPEWSGGNSPSSAAEMRAVRGPQWPRQLGRTTTLRYCRPRELRPEKQRRGSERE